MWALRLNHLALTGGDVTKTANHVKILGGVTTQRVAQVGMQIMGMYGPLGPVGGNWRQIGPGRQVDQARRENEAPPT